MEEIFHPSSKFTLSYYSSCKLKLGETSGGGGSTISCEGATPDLHLNVKLYRTESGGGFHVYNAVNDELIVQTFGYYLNENADFASQLDVNPDYADKIEFLDLLPTVYDGDFVANAYIRIRDISSENIRIRVDVKNYGANDYEKTTLGILISYPNTPAIEWNENDFTNAKYTLNACLAPMEVPEENPPFCYYLAGVGCYASASSLVESAIEHHNSNLRESEMEAYGAVSGTYIISSDQLSVSVSLLKIDGTLANIYTFGWVANPDLGS